MFFMFSVVPLAADGFFTGGEGRPLKVKGETVNGRQNPKIGKGRSGSRVKPVVGGILNHSGFLSFLFARITIPLIFLPPNTQPMKKQWLLLLSLFALTVQAQKLEEDFRLAMPEQKLPNSLYSKIGFLDSRYDTSNYGIVQLGAFNRKARVVPEVHMSLQVAALLDSMVDASKSDGRLLLQLRHFSFAEITGAMSEKGYVYVRLNLYTGSDGRYYPLASVDTVVVVKAMDVTKKMFRTGSGLVQKLIEGSLQKKPTDSVVYSFEDILRMDSIEKIGVPVYNTTAYKEGVYDSWTAFKNQQPDREVIAKMKGEKLETFQAMNEKGKRETLKPAKIYGVVYNGKPYVATNFGYYPLRREGNDFYFTGRATVTANVGDVVAATFFFGALGAVMASNNASALFDMKVDHINGGLIRLREVGD